MQVRIIAMLNPSRHVFRKEWTPQPFLVHGDVGLEVGRRATILKTATVLNHRTPAFNHKRLKQDNEAQTLADTWKHGIGKVSSRDCGPQMKRCLNDVVIQLTSVGHLSEVEMKDPNDKIIASRPPLIILPRIAS
jgi:hypothetical protein